MVRCSGSLRRAALVLTAALLAPLALTTSSAVPAGAVVAECSRTWAAPVSGSWSDPTKWSGGIVPLPTDHVCIFGNAGFTVTLDGPTEVASLQMKTGSGIVELAVVPGAAPTTTLLAHEGIDVDTNSLLTLGSATGGPGAIAVRTDPDGRIDVSRGMVVAPAETGTQDVTLEIATGELWLHANHPSYPPPGTLRVAHPLSITAGTFRTDGAVEVSAPLDVEVATRFMLNDGTIATAGPTPSDPAITVDGTVRVGGTTVAGPDQDPSQILVTDGGAIELGPGTDADLGIAIAGTVTVSGTAGPSTRLSVNGRADGTEAHARFTDTFTNRGTIVLGADEGEASRASLGADGGGTFVNEGLLIVDQGGGAGQVSEVLADVVNRGHLDLDDPLELHGDLRNEGVLELGHEELHVAPGDVVLTPTSEVSTDVPATEGDPHGLLVTEPQGSVAVDGRLQVETEGTAPPVGQTIPVIETGARTGAFTDVRFQGPASYDVQHTGTGVNLVRRAHESATRRFVRAAYQDFLGRQPDLKELSNHAGVIDSGAGTRASLVRALARSPEYVAVLVQRYYLDTLRRPGGPNEVAYWVDELRSGRRTVAQVAGAFYASNEFFQGHGQGRNEFWLHLLFVTFFEREPGYEDNRYWVARIRAVGATRVAIELFQSLESRRQRVEAVYGHLLRRGGDAQGVDYWAGRITREGDLALAVFLASSAEYLALAQERYP